jgi:adenine-specific DNA methylase
MSGHACCSQTSNLPIQTIEFLGDETDRLHRWGYGYYREMFNERQLLGLGSLLRRICQIGDTETRYALLTVFSDCLRYQNMLCRYDTYALKCQDIFSVHGFPVGLVRCEHNLLGIPHIGSEDFVIL